MPVKALTDAAVAAFCNHTRRDAPASARILFDDPSARGGVRGLGVRCTKTGLAGASFVLDLHRGGKKRRHTIGPARDMTVRDARKRARELAGAETGRPDADPTFGALADRYLAEVTPCKADSTQVSDRLAVDRDLRPALGSRRVSDIRAADVQAVHDRIAEDRPATARRTVVAASGIFTWAQRMELVPPGVNPARHVDRRPVKTRTHEPLLTPRQYVDYLTALGDTATDQCLRFIALSGVRKREATRLRWDQVDLETGRLTRPTKTGWQTRGLPGPALDLLRSLAARPDRHPEWCFPSPTRRGHPIFDPWQRHKEVARAVGAAGFRVHDFRRLLGTWMLEAGHDMTAVSALLGHTSERVSRIYAQHTPRYHRTCADQLSAVLGEVLDDGGEAGGAGV